MLKPLCMLLALVLPLAACGGTDSTEPSPFSGSYSLQTVNGANLPATLTAAGPYRLEVTAGEVRLEGSGTFSSSFNLRETTPDGVSARTSSGAGTYRQEQDAILLRTGNGQEFIGSLIGNTLTLVIDGDLYVFQK